MIPTITADPKLHLFHPGRLAITPGAKALLEEHSIDPGVLLGRHLLGDWGDHLSPSDEQANQEALKSGDRLLSSYYLDGKVESTKVWVISDAGEEPRKYYATTILLPSEY